MSHMKTHDQYFEITPNSTMEQLSEYGGQFGYLQRGVAWWVGDLARYAESRWPEIWHQVFPEWISPGLVDRCKGVAKAYPNEADRNPLCTWTQHMQVANKTNRKELLDEIVNKGLTTDESRKAVSESSKPRWLLAVDVNYHLHRHWYSGAGVGAAKQVCDWICRTVDRLQHKGLTDVVCCFDSPNNFRKAITKEWADKYKPRPPKDIELVQQLQLVRDLLDGRGLLCASVDTFEADDLMASYAAQFDGRVTILSQDKDTKQCLSERCNILLDVNWNEDPTSGDLLPDYKWYSAGPGPRLRELRTLRADPANEEDATQLDKEIDAATHPNLLDDTGLRPDQWPDYQAIWGDNVDGIKGAAGIGEKGAKDLIVEFGTLDAVIEAAKADDERITPKRREALCQLAEQVDAVRQLVTLRTDLPIPRNTRI